MLNYCRQSNGNGINRINPNDAIDNEPPPPLDPMVLFEQLKDIQSVDEANKLQIKDTDPRLNVLARATKEGNPNVFYNFNVTPPSNEALAQTNVAWPASLLLRYNPNATKKNTKIIGELRAYIITPETYAEIMYMDSNTPYLDVTQLLRLESRQNYETRISKKEANPRIIGSATNMQLFFANIEEDSRLLKDYITKSKKNGYSITRFHVFPKNMNPVNRLRYFFGIIPKPPTTPVDDNGGKTVAKLAAKGAGAGLAAGIRAGIKAFFGGNKRTRRQRQSQFKKCTRRNKHTKNRKTHKKRH